MSITRTQGASPEQRCLWNQNWEEKKQGGVSNFSGTHHPILRIQEFFWKSAVFTFMVALKTSGNTTDNRSTNNYLIYYICTCRWRETNLGIKTTINKCKLQIRQIGNWSKKIQNLPYVFRFPCSIVIKSFYILFPLLWSPSSVNELSFLLLMHSIKKIRHGSRLWECKDQIRPCPSSNHDLILCLVQSSVVRKKNLING